MAEERQFLASADEAFAAIERAASEQGKVRDPDPMKRVLKFELKMGLISNGSTWTIEIQQFGSGSMATATMRQSAVSGRATEAVVDAKKVVRLFDRADELLSGASSSPLPSGLLVPAVEPPKFSKKHEQLVPDILQALATAEVAANDNEIVAEELSIKRAERMAASGGTFAIKLPDWCTAEIQSRMAAGRLRRNVELLGKVGADLTVMSDRVLQGDKVRVIDDKVTASVEVNGEVLLHARPTLTRMAIGSVLPGSALMVGLATPKATKMDMRKASFLLVHPEWRIVEPIDPDGAQDVSGLAAQLNALIAERKPTVSHPSASPAAHAAPATGAATSVADELAKLAALRDAGVLTEEEFASAKARLLGTG